MEKTVVLGGAAEGGEVSLLGEPVDRALTVVGIGNYDLRILTGQNEETSQPEQRRFYVLKSLTNEEALRRAQAHGWWTYGSPVIET